MRKERSLERSIENLFIISIVLNILFFMVFLAIVPQMKTEPYDPNIYNVVIGSGSNPAALDPVDTWDDASRDIQHQVMQSLVEYDLSTHPNYQLKPVLSEYWIWENKTRISFKLRDNVYFHDNTRMTAEGVKWNFERLTWFCNATGNLPANESSWEAFPSELFFLENGTYIFKSFEANDTFNSLNFTINLNAPFSALLDLLTFGATNILSPYSTKFYSYLNLSDDKLIGTGPYEYIHFKRDKEVRLERWDMYWAFPGFFDVVIFRIIEDYSDLISAAYNGEFDYLNFIPGDYFCYCEPPFITVDVGEDLCYIYLEVYCGPRSTNGTILGNSQYQRNPPYLRRALALAINYTYVYDEIQSGYAVRGTTAVPRAMPGYNASIIQASDITRNYTTNLIEARQILIDNAADIIARGGVDISSFDVNNDTNWMGKNILGKALEVNRHLGSVTNLLLNQLLTTNLELIGIQINETIREWKVYSKIGEQTPWKIDIAYTGLCANYLNPYNMIDPLFNLASHTCFSRINDTSLGGLTDMMRDAISETNRSKQLDIYRNIQSYIFDVNRPLTPASHTHISGWVYTVQQSHMPDLKGVNYNVMKIIECWDWYKELED